MARMTEAELKAAVLEQIEDSEGYETDELSRLRQEALDYYFNRPSAAPTAPGRSSLQSSDVADMIEAVCAQILPAFEGESIVEFEPINENDVEQARVETDTVNYGVMQLNKGYYELQTAIRDALLLRNGLMKVWLDENTEVDKETYVNQTELEYGQVMQGAMTPKQLREEDNGHSFELL